MQQLRPTHDLPAPPWLCPDTHGLLNLGSASSPLTSSCDRCLLCRACATAGGRESAPQLVRPQGVTQGAVRSLVVRNGRETRAPFAWTGVGNYPPELLNKNKIRMTKMENHAA